jgi:hypothetical protein
VYAEYVESFLYIRKCNRDLAVEASGSEECRVKYVGSVRRRKHNDTRLVVEAVHLHKHLIECLLPLVVSAAEARAA